MGAKDRDFISKNTPLRILVCSPDYIDIQEEINIHMKKTQKPNVKKARAQWQELVAAYMTLGVENVEVWFLDPVPGLQDMCFTANGGWCRWGKVILSNFSHRIRHAEQLYYEHWFNAHRVKMLGIEIYKLPPFVYFEGQGDVVTIGHKGVLPTVLMGYGQGRTDYEAAKHLAKIHGLDEDNVIPMRLVDPRFYHLDMASNFIEPRNLFVYHREAFDSSAKRVISSLQVELYPVNIEDANNFTCNGVFIERKTTRSEISDVIYIASNPTDTFVKDMENHDIEVWRRDVSEFHKSGGANRCLTFFLPEEKSVK